MRPSLRAGLLLAVLALLVPSSALADTTVPPGGSIQDAVNAANEGDTITVQGAHSETVTVGKKVTIVGVDNASLTGSITATAAGVVVRTLSIATTGGTPVSTTGSGGLTLQGLLVQRTGGDAGKPLISAGGSTLALVDVIAVNTAGPVIAQSKGDTLVQRATLATTEAASDAVAVSAGATNFTADSSYLLGGTSAAGLRATNGMTLGSPTPMTIVLRHATLARAANGIVVDNTGGVMHGAIEATVTSSIVHEPSVAKGYAGLAGIGAVGVKVAFDRSDTPGVADADKNDQATVTKDAATQYTADLAQLVNPANLHLRVDSPAIDKGAAPQSGESGTDVDGQPRVNGPASDIGADEFVNSAPKGGIALSKADPQQGEAVTFTSTATDPDAGDAITQYYWDFGDGTPAVATDQPAVSHAFGNTGTFTVRMAVKDKGGAFSEPVSATVTVKDGAAPVVKITTPTDKSRLRLNPKAKKARKGHKKPKPPKPLPMTILGTTSDATGVLSIELAITYRNSASSKSCKQYTGKKLTKASCTRFRWVKARINGSGWQLVTKKGLRLAAGRYELRARGTDTLGNVGGPIFSAPARSLVRVTVK